MAANDRPARPLRRGFGLLACVVAGADLILATALEGNHLGIPTVPDTSRPLMLAYGALLLVVGLWSVATSFGHASAPERKASPAKRRRMEERRVVQALRELGWYVADEVSLANVDVDHVAVGPAGVLAVQTRWTDKEDARGKPAARARIAATQLRKALAARELPVEVVPAVLTFGPGLTREPGGVKVVDAVAMLNGYQSEEWLEQLGSRVLLSDDVVAAVRDTIADLREEEADRSLVSAGSTVREPALAR